MNRFKTILPFVSMLMFAITQPGCQNMADKDDYQAAASDMCNCVNLATKDLSPELKKIIANNPKDEKALEDYFERNPEQALTAMTTLLSIEEEMKPCIKDLEVKYKDIYTNDSEAEVMRKVMNVLKSEPDCKFSYALIQAGLEN